jgi:hypothetical protein
MVFIDTRYLSDRSTRVSRLESSVASRASSLAVSLAVSAACPLQSRPTSPRDSTARITPRLVCYACACGFSEGRQNEEVYPDAQERELDGN